MYHVNAKLLPRDASGSPLSRFHHKRKKEKNRLPKPEASQNEDLLKFITCETLSRDYDLHGLPTTCYYVVLRKVT